MLTDKLPAAGQSMMAQETLRGERFAARFTAMLSLAVHLQEVLLQRAKRTKATRSVCAFAGRLEVWAAGDGTEEQLGLRLVGIAQEL